MSLYSLSKDLPQRPKVQVFAINKRHFRLVDGKEINLSQLARFIPTEIIAPYAAALSLVPDKHWNPITVYVAFVIATPFAMLLFATAAQISSKGNWPEIPPLLWRAVAAMIAFSVWGLVVPNNPFQAQVGGATVAGLAAMIVSPVLEALDRIVLKVLTGTSK